MQRRHAPLADGVETRKGLLRVGDGFLIEVRDQPVGGVPGLFGGFPHDDMQADTEAYWRPFAAALARTSSIFSLTCAGGSPR